MADSAFFNTSAGEAYLGKSFGPLGTVYVAVQIYMTSAVKTIIDGASTFSGDFFDLADNSVPSNIWEGVNYYHLAPTWATVGTPTPSLPAFTANTWHQFEITYTDGRLDQQIALDGVIYTDTLFGPLAAAGWLDIGQRFAGAIASTGAYIGQVWVGSAAGLHDIVHETWAGGTTANWPTSVGSVTVGTAPSAPPPLIPTLVVHPTAAFHLCDLATDTTILDLTNSFNTMNVKVRGNRPLAITLTVPADQVRGNWVTDGLPNLSKGIRTLKYYRKGVLRGHVRVWNIEWDGDENAMTAQITGYDPMAELLARPVRDTTGNMVNPTFATPISGAAILKGAIENSVSNSGGAGDMEGALPLDTAAGTFDTTIPPAVDLAAELTDWPITIGDLYALLTQTGAVDVICDPVDTSMGFAAGVIGSLSIVNKAGTNLTASIHFDYDTGSHNIAKLRRVDGIDTLCNKLIYELGPRIDKQHWKGNITATETTPVNLAAYLALETASRAKYGTFCDIRVFDSADENNARPLWHQLWKTEVTLRVNGRELLYNTPIAEFTWEPFNDYGPFDTVAVNASDLCGRTITAETQRIYGFDIDMDGSESVERVGELVTSADAE